MDIISELNRLKGVGIVENSGLLREMENLRLANRTLERLIDEAAEIVSKKSQSELISYCISCLVEKFIPSYLVFILEDLGCTGNLFMYCFRNMQPIDCKLELVSIDKFKEFFSKYPNPISFQLLDYQMESPADTGMLKALNPEIVVPIVGIGGVYGFIVFGEKVLGEEYTQEEINYIDKLMKFTSTSLQNNLHYTTAVTDVKTQLYNHAFFMKRLEEELAIVRRYESQIGLIILDVDHFKIFNDTYGHMAGDVVLNNIARVLEKSIRKGDIPARFGGEEFVVLLLRSSREDSIAVAERIRRAVEEAVVEYSGKNLAVTVSIGVSYANPDNPVSSGDLIKRADAALYQAKKAGRNRVFWYAPGLLFQAMNLAGQM